MPQIPKLYKQFYFSGLTRELASCHAAFDCASINETLMNKRNMSGIVAPYPKFWFETVLDQRGELTRLGVIVENEIFKKDNTILFKWNYFAEGVGCKPDIASLRPFIFETDINGNLLDAYDVDKIGFNRFCYNIYSHWNRCNFNDFCMKVEKRFGGRIAVKDQFIICHVVMNLICGMCKFLSCNNIKVNEHDIQLKDREKRILKKHNHKPDIKYHTLVVEMGSGKKKKYIELTDLENHGKMRGHTCRGHNQTYTEDGPLFGKHVGTWYWNPCFKGSIENGLILKDYKLVPSNKPSALYENIGRIEDGGSQHFLATA